MMSAFDYPYTCPDIDKAIKKMRSDVALAVEQTIEDEENRTYLSDRIADEVADYFEEVRKSNDAMRKEAERQLEAKGRTIEDMESRINELLAHRDDLRRMLRQCEAELAEADIASGEVQS